MSVIKLIVAAIAYISGNTSLLEVLLVGMKKYCKALRC